MKQVLTILIIFLLGALSCFFPNNFLFILPLLTFLIISGLKYFLTCLVSIIFGFFHLLSNNYEVALKDLSFLLIAFCLFFFFYYLFLLLKRKLIINYYLSTILSLLLTLGIYYYDKSSFDIASFLTNVIIIIILTYSYSFLFKHFSLQMLYSSEEISGIIIALLLTTYFSIIPYLIYLIIPIIVFFALKASIKNVFIFLAALFLANKLIDLSLINDYFYLFALISLPLSFNFKKYRIGNFIIIIAAFTINYYLTKLEFSYYYLALAIEVAIISLFISNKKANEKIDFLKVAFDENKKEINFQLSNFEDMFVSLSDNFIKARKSMILQKAKKEVFDTLCASCPKIEYCHQKGKHLLLNYLNDSLSNTLTDNKIRYIRQNCLKQNAYFTLLDKFTKSYLIKKYQNEEEAKLKKYISNNFQSFAVVMEECKSNINNNRTILSSTLYKSLKEALVSFDFDVIYVKNLSEKDEYAFDIAISSIHKKDIEDKLMPIINKILKSNMVIVDLTVSTISFTYYIISIVEQDRIDVKYALKQSNEDYHCNGDSYIVIDNKNKFYLAISDGMGHGFDANEESAFALSTLSCFLKSKIDSYESINLTNDILQIKNDFESYSTLDLIDIDKQNKKAKFYKLGAFTSFILRDNQLISIDNYSLPIGIVDEVKINELIVPIYKNDIIIMCSDGMIDDTSSDITSIIKSLSFDAPVVLCQSLFEKLISVRANHDDATLAIITIN